MGKPLSYILATPARPDDADTTLTRVFGNEGAEEDLTRFAQRFGCHVVDSYGSTEGGATVQRTPDTPHGALGRAPEDTLVVDPATGEECPRAVFDGDGRLTNAEEATGELVSKSGGAGFEGYWDNNDAEQARLRNGWYWTGDLASRDAAGFFYFAGRSDDWLRVDGENFAAAPVARILLRHPDIAFAVVYAVPDPVAGDQVMAACNAGRGGVRPEGFRCLPVPSRTWGQVGAALRPRGRALPTTATSKVLTRTLRAERWRCSDRCGGPPTGPREATTGSSIRPTPPTWTGPPAAHPVPRQRDHDIIRGLTRQEAPVVEDLEDPRRPEPPFVLDERPMLEAWLESTAPPCFSNARGSTTPAARADRCRAHCSRCTGPVRHMAEVERIPFWRVLLRQPTTPPIWYDPAVEDSELVPLYEADPGRPTSPPGLPNATPAGPPPPPTSWTTPASATANPARCDGSTST